MIKNYLTIALRNLVKNKGFSIINIAGLSLGMVCCIMIFMWIQDEISFDRYHDKIDSIYLVRTEQTYGTKMYKGAGTPPAVGPAFKAEYPEIINAVRFQNGTGEALLRYNDIQAKEEVQLADPSMFEIFTFPLKYGNAQDAYQSNHVMVISEDVSQKYFGDENPVGKTMNINNDLDFTIVGVMQNIPHNSIFGFDVWIPLEFANELYNRENYTKTWYNLAFRTYVEFDGHADLEVFNKKIEGRILQEISDNDMIPFLYPFKDVYLKMWGRMSSVILFSMIAGIILVIACINFINMTTARSAQRAQEVGLRKVIGAQRSQLIAQFFGESIILTVIALIISIALIEMVTPLFNTLTGKNLTSHYLTDIKLVGGILMITLITGIVSGLYPAVYLASLKPVKILKGISGSEIKGSQFRKGLVVVQFSISIILIINAAIVFKQVEFMKNKSLGFDKEYILHIPIEGNLETSHESMKQELLQYPAIQNVTVTSNSPKGIYWNGSGWQWQGKDQNIDPLVTYLTVDPDFLETFKMEMAEGRFLLSGNQESSQNIIINEAFAEIMGREIALGNMMHQGDDDTYNVVGIIKDFHFKPVHRNIGPIIIFGQGSFQRFRYMFIRIDSENVGETIAMLESTFKKFNPDFPFEFHFLDSELDELYKGTDRLMGIIRTFAVIAIFISCLGLFGLAAFMAERRTKEIGIRKILGATVTNIIALLSKEFMILLAISNLIAWFISYFIMSTWLQNYAYRIEFREYFWIFPSAALVSITIAFFTVNFQSVKASFVNPVDSLKCE